MINNEKAEKVFYSERDSKAYLSLMISYIGDVEIYKSTSFPLSSYPA